MDNRIKIRSTLINENEYDIKLNLGCGTDYIDTWINLDNNKEVNSDVVCDIDGFNLHLPFEDNYFDLIWASHILEHIVHIQPLKRELYRILKPNGLLIVIVPHYLSMDAWGDDTHVRAFSEHSFFPQYWPGFQTHKSFPITVKDCWDNTNTWLGCFIVKGEL